MIFRQAQRSDIAGMQRVRHLVQENRLSDPSLVPDTDVEDFIQNRGRGWVCYDQEQLVGFAIISLRDNMVWALFMEPGFDRKGAGRKLQELMLDWYFEQTSAPVWLSTAPGTRAEQFYRRAGWRETGIYGKNELRFELSADDWNKNR